MSLKTCTLLIVLVVAMGFGVDFLSARSIQSDSVKFVVHISVDGLRPDAVTALGPDRAPNFFRLRQEGAFTDNARTDDQFTNTLPNHAGMLTGRRVLGAGGHGVTFNDNHPGTFESVHGSYVAGAFDVVHDRGFRTGLFYSKDKFDFYARSWDENHGASDTVGTDNGSAKIDRSLFLDDTSILTDEWVSDMDADPYHYSFVHFRDPDTFGHARGWMSPQYLDAVEKIDAQLGRMFDLIDNDSLLAGTTAIVLTSDHGGLGSNHVAAGVPLHFTIPLYVWGPNVDAGADLYELNWATRQTYCMTEPGPLAAKPPIRNIGSGNLAMALLGLPSVPGSTVNGTQDILWSLPEGVVLPEISFESPETNQRFTTGGSISFSAEASSSISNIERVVFEWGCDTLAVVTEPPFVTEWNLAPPGSHVARATVFDIDGRFRSDTVTVEILEGISMDGSDSDWLALGIAPVLDTDGLQKDPELELNRLLFYEDDDSYYFGFDASVLTKRVAYGLYLDVDGLRGDAGVDPIGHAIKGSRQHTPEMAFYFIHDAEQGWNNSSASFFITDSDTKLWQEGDWPTAFNFSADTAFGFVEFSFPKTVITDYPGAMGMYATLFAVGEAEGAGASDSIPSDEDVAFVAENTSTETTTISAFHDFTFPRFEGERIKIDGNRFDWFGSSVPMIRNNNNSQADVELAPDRFYVTHDIDNYYFAFLLTTGPKEVTVGLYIDSGDHLDPARGAGNEGSAIGNAVFATNFLPDVQIYFVNDTTGAWTIDTPRYFFWDNTGAEWDAVSEDQPGLPEGSAFGAAVFGGTSFVELSIPRTASGIYDSETLLIELFTVGDTPGAGASATIPHDPNISFAEENTSTEVTVLSSPHTYTTRPIILGTESPEEIPRSLELIQNYPNPFSTTATIEYRVGRSQPVRLAVYDMLGRLQQVLVDQWTLPGQHQTTVDAARLASGTYILRIEGVDQASSRPLVVVH